ncbi:MAG: hypothetical protein WDA06_01820 [Phenylobacterium sp.]
MSTETTGERTPFDNMIVKDGKIVQEVPRNNLTSRLKFLNNKIQEIDNSILRLQEEKIKIEQNILKVQGILDQATTTEIKE